MPATMVSSAAWRLDLIAIMGDGTLVAVRPASDAVKDGNAWPDQTQPVVVERRRGAAAPGDGAGVADPSAALRGARGARRRHPRHHDPADRPAPRRAARPA